MHVWKLILVDIIWLLIRTMLTEESYTRTKTKKEIGVGGGAWENVNRNQDEPNVIVFPINARLTASLLWFYDMMILSKSNHQTLK